MKRLFFVLLVLLFLPTQALSGLPGAVLNENGFSEQAQSAADAAFNAVSGLATKGEAVRGGSGPLAELALNSGSIICNSWIISIRQNIKSLSIASSRMGSDSEEYIKTADAIRKLTELAEIVERECTEKDLIGQPPSSSGVASSSSGVTGGSSGATEGSSGQSSAGGRPATPRDGETVADEICRRQCESQQAAMYRAERDNDRKQEEARKTRQRADEAKRALEEAERNLNNARTERDRLKGNKPPAMGSNASNALLRQWEQYNNSLNNLERQIPDIERQLSRLRDRNTSAQRVADFDAGEARRAQEAYAAAVNAYNACLRRCVKTAKDAGEGTTLVVPGGGTAVNKSATSNKGKKDRVKTGEATVELESVNAVDGTNAFDAKEVEKVGKGDKKVKKEPEPKNQPPKVEKEPYKPVVVKTPEKVIEPPKVVKTEPKQPPVEEEPFQVNLSGSIGFVHTVGSSPCPQAAGSVTIYSSVPMDITGVSTSGSIAPKLTVNKSGSGTSHTITVFFNCSSPDKGSFSGTITVNTKSKGGETKAIPIPANGTVK